MSLQPNADCVYNQRAASNLGAEAAYGASRKSARRDDGEDNATKTLLSGGGSSLPPSSPAQAVASCDSGSVWGASLPPRGYTAACRAAEREGAPALATATTITAVVSPPPIAGLPYRWKRRRMEQVSFTSLCKEVFMYLDTVAATQQDNLMEGENVAGVTHGQGSIVAGVKAEEDVQAEREQWRLLGYGIVRNSSSIVLRSYSAPSSPSACGSSSQSQQQQQQQQSFFHVSPAPHSTRFPGSNGGTPATPLTAALCMPVSAAVEDTLRVLRACWEYRGAPHDAFEPVRLLSPVTVHLLTTYGHHTITHDGEYIVLCGGAEQLPWVGCLYGILQSYMYQRQQQRQQSPADGAAGLPQADATRSISRVLLLNCHSFGWLDHIGSDEYERSHRRLYQAREALISLLEDERYSALGGRAACPLCSAMTVGGDASTSILLGDTIVMEGGAPSLGLASSRDTFTAHYQYGRGIACCVPEQRQTPQETRPESPEGSPGSANGRGGGDGGSGRREGGGSARKGLCAAHRWALREARRRRRRSDDEGNGVRWPTQPPPLLPINQAEEEEESSSVRGRGMVPCVSPPSPPPLVHLSGPILDVSPFPPVCCGACRAAGVLGQAVLLGPTGPLLLHLQFEEREWLEAAGPLLGYGGVGGAEAFFGASGQGGWPLAETTAVCPAPLVSTASLRRDPAGALAAVLYAQMQGHDTAGLRQSPSHPQLPFATLPSGGAVSLAEFVEWLVRLLHTPPPALVVEWHSCSHADDGSCAESNEQLTYTVSPSSLTPSPYPENMYSGANAHGGAAAQRRSTSSASSAELPHTNQSHGGSSNSSASPPAPPPPPPLPPSAPLGMVVRPRLAVVPQLLETYADVMGSRSATDAPNAGRKETTFRRQDPRRLHTPPPPAVGSPGGGGSSSLQSSLSRASRETVGQDEVRLDWVLAARDALQPCDAAAFFDGVERPLVLAKGLEVVVEGERYVNPNSVVTSLQFRPCPSGVQSCHE